MPTARMLLETRGGTDRVQPSLFDAVAIPRAKGGREVAFATLASSSAGNCSVVRIGTGDNHRLMLIDCGISPRRTRRTLAQLGTDIEKVDEVLLTHLDQDHCHRGWAKALPSHARFRVFEGHMARARRAGIAWRRLERFGDAFEIAGVASVQPVLMAHDASGVAAFRIDFVDGCSLGYATDLGRSSAALEQALAGVDVLAVESNYCPVMQAESDRPAFVKERITGGSGHLSNEESAALVSRVRPRLGSVLLHLSRQCNTPETALRAHEPLGVPTFAAFADEPTEWFDLVGPNAGVLRSSCSSSG